jgi:hypothetical protein
MEEYHPPLSARELQERGLVTRAEMEMELSTKANDFDHYATSKSISQTMLNTASIQSLLVILVSVFKDGATALDNYEIALVALIAVSLCLQFTIFVLLVILAKSRKEQFDRCNCTTTSINSTVTSLTGLLLIITSAISILKGHGAPL